MATNSSVIYRSIITAKFRTEKMYTFYKTVNDDADGTTLYVSFGKGDAWADNESAVGFAPPYPADDTDSVVDVWSNMMGAVKIPYSMLDCVIPRRDWGDSNYANSNSFSIGDIVVSNSGSYNKTDSSSGWLVYKCVDIPSEGVCSIADITDKNECITIGGTWTASTQSTVTPHGTGDTNGNVDTGDGYLWEYLYEIPADVSINKCTNEYIVVPWPDQIEQDPASWGYANNLTWQQDDYGLIYRIKANMVRFTAYLDSINFPQFSLPGNKGFRQLSIITNPLEAKVNASDPNVKCLNSSYIATNMFRQSGEMIYIENRQPVIRAMDQTEQVAVVFEF